MGPSGIISPGQTGLKGQIGGDIERGDQVELLKHQPDAIAAQGRALRIRGLRHIGAIHHKAATVGAVEPSDQMQKRAFARPGFTRQRKAFARRQRQINAVQHPHRLVPGAVGLGHPGCHQKHAIPRAAEMPPMAPYLVQSAGRHILLAGFFRHRQG